jgi:hypothetical protein
MKNGKRKIESIRIAGESIQPFRKYRIAIPEGVGRGVVEITPALKAILHDSRDTGVPVWSAIEEKLRRESRNGKFPF